MSLALVKHVSFCCFDLFREWVPIQQTVLLEISVCSIGTTKTLSITALNKGLTKTASKALYSFYKEKKITLNKPESVQN